MRGADGPPGKPGPPGPPGPPGMPGSGIPMSFASEFNNGDTGSGDDVSIKFIFQLVII